MEWPWAGFLAEQGIVGLGWIGLSCDGLSCDRLDCVGCDCSDSGWAPLVWAGLGSVVVGCSASELLMSHSSVVVLE